MSVLPFIRVAHLAKLFVAKVSIGERREDVDFPGDLYYDILVRRGMFQYVPFCPILSSGTGFQMMVSAGSLSV